jgi:hypothetical protein
MGEITKVKEMHPLGGATRVVLENGNIFTVRTDRVEEMKITQGTELRIEETEKDIFLYVGEKILGSYEPR